MKFLSIIFFNLILLASANASAFKDKISIVSNANTSKLELKYQSGYRKNLQGNVRILNAEGQEVKNFTCEIINGENSVCLKDSLNLKEGIYTIILKVKRKSLSTKLILFK